VELSAHFAIEESPAHLGVMARRRPDLLPLIVDLKADHAALLRALSRIEMAASEKSRWGELPALVSALCTDLDAHESAEAELVSTFFSSGG
jgi:hypothetical protein